VQGAVKKVAVARRPVPLSSQEVIALLGKIRHRRETEEPLELRAILRLVIGRMTVDGQICQIHYKPEARPWFCDLPPCH
jgi:hypothetical protein